MAPKLQASPIAVVFYLLSPHTMIAMKEMKFYSQGSGQSIIPKFKYLTGDAFMSLTFITYRGNRKSDSF